MATTQETVEFILQNLEPRGAFAARKMFGEYALYANSKVVALVCDDTLYVKITPQSAELESLCEKHPPYPGASLYYLVEESLISQLPTLSEILLNISAHLPAKKPKKK
jgi:DNA transformation protein and related proteins